MRAYELEEAWSKKYKRSIDCNNPKGFSQRAHCAGRKKNKDLNEFSMDQGDNGGDDKKNYLLQLAQELYDLMYGGKRGTPDQVREVKRKIELAGGSVKIIFTADGWQTVMYHPTYFKQGYLIKVVGQGDPDSGITESYSFKLINEGIDDFKKVHSAIKDLLPVAMAELGLDQLPKIHIKKNLDNKGQPSFGSFNGTDITLAVSGRHPVDICRTLAHELTHYRQGTDNQLDHESGRTGSPEENEANSVAGIIMRKFSQKHPEYMKNEN